MSDRQHAIAAHLEIVTHHPRTFLGRVEVAALDRVVEEDRVGVPQAVVAVVVTMMRAGERLLASSPGDVVASAGTSSSEFGASFGSLNAWVRSVTLPRRSLARASMPSIRSEKISRFIFRDFPLIADLRI